MSFAAVHAVVEIASTVVATTTIPVNVDLGGALPKFVIARAINRSGAGAGAATVKISVGFATSTSLLYSSAVATQTGVTPANAARSINATSIMHEISPSNVAGGLIGISDMSTPDQLTLIVNTQLVETHTIGLQIFAGNEITNATIIEYVKTNSLTGPISVTSPGFPVKFAMFMGVGTNAIPNSASSGIFYTLGRALPATGKNHLLAQSTTDNVAASDTSSYCNDDECIAEHASTVAINYRAAVTSQLPTGFIINEIENGSTQLRRYAVLCVGGIFSVEFVSFLTQTDTTTDIQPACGFTPLLADLWSHCRVESTSDTPQATTEMSLGTAIFPSVTATNFALAFIDPDNANPTTTASALAPSDDAYINLTAAGAVEGLMRVSSDPVNALGLLMSDADPSQNFVTGAVFGAVVLPPVMDAMMMSIGRSFRGHTLARR